MEPPLLSATTPTLSLAQGTPASIETVRPALSGIAPDANRSTSRSASWQRLPR